MTSSRTNSPSRRSIIPPALDTSLLSGGIGGTGLAVAADRQVERRHGLVSLYPFGAITLHSYMAPGTHANGAFDL